MSKRTFMANSGEKIDFTPDHEYGLWESGNRSQMYCLKYAQDHWKEITPKPVYPRYFLETDFGLAYSLRRSHRYAAKYNEGKAAGKKEAQAEIDELKKQCQSSYKQGRDAGAHEVESYRKASETYQREYEKLQKTVEHIKAMLEKQYKISQDWNDKYLEVKNRLGNVQAALADEEMVPW